MTHDEKQRGGRGWQVGIMGKRLAAGVNLVGMLVMILMSSLGGLAVTQAAAIGPVVINEIAWSGSVNSANDEWIELYNSGPTAVDLNGWKIRYNNADLITFAAGYSIPASGYFLIERSEAATSVPADLVASMTLVNTGASLDLVNAAGVQIDLVNSAKTAWFAGSATTRATMERIDPAVSGDLSSNWISSNGSGATASAGGLILGTPRSANSASTGIGSQSANTSAKIQMELSSVSPAPGDILKVKINAENITDLFAYGMELNYDSAALQYENVVNGPFLSNGGTVSTTFQKALKDGKEGDLLLAEARTAENKSGQSGSGNLLEIAFRVIGADGMSGNISFAPAGTFAANSVADVQVNWLGNEFTIKSNTIEAVRNAAFKEGPARYQIKLNWDASLSAPDHYRVERQDAHGNWKVLAGVTGNEFLDQDSVNGGGKIIPGYTYHYRISAVKGAVISQPVEILGQDGRGLKGDFNRSDLVDGRDLEKLARVFGLNDAQSDYDVLVDANYDGYINGSDLIDLGTNFAKQY